MMETKYPECEKLNGVSAFSQKIGEFLDWLEQELSCSICTAHSIDDMDEDDPTDYGDLEEVYLPVLSRKEKLLAKFFNIDLNKIEKERRQMLGELQKQERKD